MKMASSSTSTISTASYNSPCAACKFLRRKCLVGCIFAPYFPPEEPHKFANVHKIFGASNVAKLLNELLPHQREDAVNSLAYEAEARVRDPVYGCVGAISYLQRQVHRLQKELDAANADLLRFACHDMQGITSDLPLNHHHHHYASFYHLQQQQQPSDHHHHHQPAESADHQQQPYDLLPWNDSNVDHGGGGDDDDDDNQGNM